MFRSYPPPLGREDSLLALPKVTSDVAFSLGRGNPPMEARLSTASRPYGGGVRAARYDIERARLRRLGILARRSPSMSLTSGFRSGNSPVMAIPAVTQGCNCCADGASAIASDLVGVVL